MINFVDLPTGFLQVNRPHVDERLNKAIYDALNDRAGLADMLRFMYSWRLITSFYG